MRDFSFFFAFFAAFFSFAVMAGSFLVSLLLFCSLLIAFLPLDYRHSTGESALRLSSSETKSLRTTLSYLLHPSP